MEREREHEQAQEPTRAAAKSRLSLDDEVAASDAAREARRGDLALQPATALAGLFCLLDSK